MRASEKPRDTFAIIGLATAPWISVIARCGGFSPRSAIAPLQELQDGAVHHTYSTYARGVEALMGTYQFLDLAPLGRNEDGLEFLQAWWRRHDEYGK